MGGINLPDPLLMGQLLLQIVLIAINAVFACSEIAVVSLNERKIEKLADEGNKKAEKILIMLRMPDRFLSTIQVCITLAGFMGSAFAAGNLAQRITDWLYFDINFTTLGYDGLESLNIVNITLILSYFTLVLGELVPKRIAMKNPEKVAFGLCGLLSFIWLRSSDL